MERHSPAVAPIRGEHDSRWLARRRRLVNLVTTLWMALVIAAAVVLFTSTDASATIIDNDWYTTDTSTGLDWADLTLTNNVSWNQMQSGAAHATYAAAGWLDSGWRYATHDEVLMFWHSVSGIAVDGNYSHLGVDIQGLVGALVGNTRLGYAGQGVYRSSYGLIAENFNSHYTHWMGLHHYGSYNSTYGVDPLYNISMNNTSATGWGSWLVRSGPAAVPEPTTWGLMFIGLVALAVARRQRLKPAPGSVRRR